MPLFFYACVQSAALSRVTLVGRIVPVEKEELPPLKTAYSIVHSYSERLVESPKFSFCKVRPTVPLQESMKEGVVIEWL